ncbi:YjgP/YjgQ family permease [bacterium]|nr:YjgP/YjgQ family permease [bacterium]
MRVLPRYVLGQAVVALGMTLAVFTFVLLLGGLLRRLSELLVNRQLGLDTVVYFLLLVLPSVLSFSLPLAILATALLVFGRLSADHEITAMRASGISIGQVAAPVILLAVLMGGLCFYINASLSPRCRFQFRTLFVRLGIERPLALIEAGTYLRDFPGYVLYVGRKKANVLEDITVYMLDGQGRVVSSLRARRGTVTARRETQTLLLDLYEVRGDLRDPDDPTNLRRMRTGTTADRYPLELDLGRVLRRARKSKKLRDYTLTELREEIASLREKGVYPAAAVMEAQKRITGAVACVSFVLVGIPLGLKTSRRETTIGIALSLGLALLYYVVVIVAGSLADRPHLYPELILWVPNLLFQIIGLWLLWRVSST